MRGFFEKEELETIEEIFNPFDGLETSNNFCPFECCDSHISPFTKMYYNTIFKDTISLKKLNFFDMNINLTTMILENLNNLEECLFYEYYQNIKKCTKYIGFHHCGNCNNNNENYCTKIIEGNNYNFYYLEDQINIPKYNRTCIWSNNNTHFNRTFYQIPNYYYYFFKEEKECDNNLGYYKIENEPFKCVNSSPYSDYALDETEKEWRKCNERCETCANPSKTDDHKCLSCKKDYNYYPYKIDYDNFLERKISTINCFHIEEVKSKYLNYFLNENYTFEKCNISCEECISKNSCIKCAINYYNIYGYENGTCFPYPLDNYRLVIINNKAYFQKCNKYCKNCNKITQSFLYQQCNECDEINFTLDMYSLNQSYCIPKDNSTKTDSYFIQKKKNGI